LTGPGEDHAGASADLFLSELVPQVAEQLAAQHASTYDATASSGRFAAWLEASTAKPDTSVAGRARRARLTALARTGPAASGPGRERPAEAVPGLGTGEPPAAGRARIGDISREALATAAYARVLVDMATILFKEPWYQAMSRPGNGHLATRSQPLSVPKARARRDQPKHAQPGPQPSPALPSRPKLPYVPAHPAGHPDIGDGRVNCGSLEKILHRQWDEGDTPPAQVVTSVRRLAKLPCHIQDLLADGLDGIFVGPGGVPDLADMGALKGVPLPSGQATWDACAGAYGDRKIVVGSRRSPAPDVTCHEVGHALDDLDSPPGKWRSDSAEFRLIYDQCQPYIASDFHRQRGGLGRKEFFADAFATIASEQRPKLVDMLSGNTRVALRAMVYFNRHYQI
jgi:hypothetical protein